MAAVGAGAFRGGIGEFHTGPDLDLGGPESRLTVTLAGAEPI